MHEKYLTLASRNRPWVDTSNLKRIVEANRFDRYNARPGQIMMKVWVLNDKDDSYIYAGAIDLAYLPAKEDMDAFLKDFLKKVEDVES